ncbi:MAG TPA: sugar ABC transporter permease [Anaerolineae bacterium]|nr:sugar ABC transporter permease [Anaerolineae bacterium]HMR65024.1 sugar ABC transporter permease [Anaerolineae bacterium]
MTTTTSSSATSSSTAASSPRGVSSQRRSEILTAWLFSTPAIVLLTIFLFIPFVMAIGLAFTDQRLVPNPNLPTQFVGLRNFERMFQDGSFYNAVFNNFLFALIVVPLQTSLALLLAMLINQKLKGMNVFRTIYFSPTVVIMVVVAVIWTFLYNPGAGLINEFIQFVSFGYLGPYDWLNNPNLALPAIIVLSIWQGVGFQMVVYLAGLQEIPDFLYESAQIDGASKLQQFLYITLPQLRNTTIFVALTTTILAFRLFTQVWVMQGPNGSPQESTLTMMVYTVNQGFQQGRIGYASAITVAFFIIVLVISILQRVFLREERAVA